MGVVFEAEHLIVGRRLAVKVLSHEWADDPNMGQRFRAEARAASAAGHPNIVEVFDAGELDDGRPYIVMEFLEGREALLVLRDEAPLDVFRVCRMIRDVARGVHVAHEAGVVHRDLKAENVLVVASADGKRETVKVLDFGIATRGDPSSSRMTSPGVAVGTPEYMAPEQAFGARPEPAFDIYAIGVLMFEMLTGAPPFVSDRPVQVLSIKAATPAPRVTTQRSDVPRAVADLIAECLEIDPEERPRTAGEIADRLEAILEAEARAMAFPAPLARRRVHGWAVAGATGTALAAVLAMFAVGLSPEPTPIAVTGGGVAEASVPGLDVDALPRAELHPASVPIEPAPEPEPEPIAEPAPIVGPTPAPPRPRKSTPRPKPAGTPIPATPPPEPAKTTATETTPSCEHDRRRAADARIVHDWSGTLRHTADATCWPSALERKRLRVQALMELERWSACLAEAEGAGDPKIQRWATICSKRSEQ